MSTKEESYLNTVMQTHGSVQQNARPIATYAQTIGYQTHGQGISILYPSFLDSLSSRVFINVKCVDAFPVSFNELLVSFQLDLREPLTGVDLGQQPGRINAHFAGL